MARPKKSDDQRRDAVRLVRLTKLEDVALIGRAKTAGMNPSEFLRETALRRRFIPRPPLAEAEFLLYIRGEIGRTGNNLNQLVQRLNLSNLNSIKDGAQTVLNELHQINQTVLKLLHNGSYSREV